MFLVLQRSNFILFPFLMMPIQFQNLFVLSFFEFQEFSKPSSVCSVCHSPVSVTTSKTDNPWRAQTDILPPYHNNTTNTTRGDESGMSSDWPR